MRFRDLWARGPRLAAPSWFCPAAALSLLVWFAMTSCAEVEGPDTQVMLRIQSEDALLLTSMTSLQVSFALEESDGKTWQTYPTREFAKGVLRWPVDIPIVPTRPDDASKRFEVVIEAIDGSRVLAQQRAVTGFVPGGLRLLELWLYRCPGHENDARACAASGCEHEACGVCELDGTCRGSSIDRERLSAFSVGEDPISRPPPGLSGPAGGGGGEAGVTSSDDSGATQGPGGANGMTGSTGGGVSGMQAGMPGGSGIDAGGSPAGATMGATDAGESDTGARDAGGVIGGFTGGVSLDAGLDASVDAGNMDASAAEAGAQDAGKEGGSISGSIGGSSGGTGGSTGGFIGGMFGGGTTAGSSAAFIIGSVPNSED